MGEIRSGNKTHPVVDSIEFSIVGTVSSKLKPRSKVSHEGMIRARFLITQNQTSTVSLKQEFGNCSTGLGEYHEDPYCRRGTHWNASHRIPLLERGEQAHRYREEKGTVQGSIRQVRQIGRASCRERGWVTDGG